MPMSAPMSLIGYVRGSEAITAQKRFHISIKHLSIGGKVLVGLIEKDRTFLVSSDGQVWNNGTPTESIGGHMKPNEELKIYVYESTIRAERGGSIVHVAIGEGKEWIPFVFLVGPATSVYCKVQDTGRFFTLILIFQLFIKYLYLFNFVLILLIVCR